MPLRIILASIIGCLLVSSNQAQQPVKVLNDSLGDPLPPWAIARLGTLRFVHQAGEGTYVSKAVYSQDGRRIVSLGMENAKKGNGSGGGSIRVWDAGTGKKLDGPWNGTKVKGLSGIAISPDGSTLAAWGWDQIAVWEIDKQKLIRTFKVDELANVAFTDKGTGLVTASRAVVKWWNVTNDTEVGAWRPFGDMVFDPNRNDKTAELYADGYDLSPDGKLLAARFRHVVDNQGGSNYGLRDPQVALFDLADRKELWKADVRVHAQACVWFSGSGKCIAIEVAPDKLEVRDSHSGKALRVVPNAPQVFGERSSPALALAGDGSAMAFAGSNPGFGYLDLNGVLGVQKILGPATTRYIIQRVVHAALVFSPDDKTLLLGFGGVLIQYHVPTLKPLKPAVSLCDAVDHVKFTSNGKQLVTGSYAKGIATQEVIRWDVATWKSVKTTSTATPEFPNIRMPSPDHSVYVGLTGEDRFELFDMATGKVLSRLEIPPKQNPEALCWFSSDDNFYMLSGNDSAGKAILHLFSVSSGKFLCQLPAFLLPFESLRSVAFSPDGCWVAIISRQNGQMHVFETGTGKLLFSFGQESEPRQPAFTYLCFSADSKFLALWTKADNAIRIWEVSTGKRRVTLVDLGPYIAFSPDGRTLAIADKTIQLIELSTLKVRREFSGHEGPIRSLAFSPDGKLLASGSADTTVLIWDVWGR